MDLEDLFTAAGDALRELADALSDQAADAAADRGAVGHKTPAPILNLYHLADLLDAGLLKAA